MGILGWIVAIALAGGARLMLVDWPVSLFEGVAWCLLAGAPAGLALALFRDPSSSTIAQVLYEAEHPVDRSRER
jgi:hypothetical protein